MTTPRTRKVQRYGWIPDLPDHRDLAWSAPPEAVAALPAAVDLRPGFAPPYDQGDLGSCTANAVAAAFQFARRKEGLTDFMPSRLFVYFNERVIEGTVSEDSGAMLRDGLKCVVQQGVCPERSRPPRDCDWPYDPAHFATRPPQRCYEVALDFQVLRYKRVARSVPQLKACLAAGFPFVFGFAVYESFETAEVARTGVASLPGPKERMLGGHAVVAVGYDDAARRFLVRNSWGERWGQAGYFTLPYAYLESEGLSADFWTIRQTE
ncbi:C1 family peptidase [Anaeromyxobacter paludicola]|uniref:Peptidase C1 n=1 Tax=Anaeromyxobacter paludicola TaxID=2918171 RepID=A0ABM7XBD4_9BACT|nr:C1 family peptidase [Anaeromyxobacter paludicola]BDG09158.1 peptidase C1 [Anaeromyxobacter paludicola]